MLDVRIAAIDGELASEPLDDVALAAQLALSLEEVQRLSRGLIRTSAPDGEGPAVLAGHVARRMLESVGVPIEDVGMIVFATTTPDLTFPGAACLLQATLQGRGVPCLDVRSQCTGFLTALDVARRFVGCGTYRRVLIAAADVPTHMLRYDGRDPELSVLAGDGAAVALVEPGRGRGEVLSCAARVDGKRYRQFWCEFPASRHMGRNGVARGERVCREAFESGAMYPRVDLDALRTSALADVPQVFDEAVASAGLDRVDAAIVTHISPDVEDDLRAALASRVGRFVVRRSAYGFGSTLPLALVAAAGSAEIRVGETVALVTAGAGASFGAAVVRW